MNLDDPTTVALAASEALARAGLPHALYGGLVLAAFGEPRETRDVDFAVSECTAGAASAAFTAAQLAHRVAFEDVRFGGLSISRLSLLPGTDDTGLNTVDLVRPLPDRYAAAVLERRLEGPLRNRTVALVSPEDFVILKCLSTRDRDLDDAASVLARNRDRLELDLMAREIDLLSREVPTHDVMERFRAVHARADNLDRFVLDDIEWGLRGRD